MENTEYGKHGVWKTRCAWSCSIFRFILMKMKLALRMWLTNTFSFFCAILELPEFIISQENFRSKRLKLRAWRPVLGYWAFIFSVRNEQKCVIHVFLSIFSTQIYFGNTNSEPKIIYSSCSVWRIVLFKRRQGRGLPWWILKCLILSIYILHVLFNVTVPVIVDNVLLLQCVYIF